MGFEGFNEFDKHCLLGSFALKDVWMTLRDECRLYVINVNICGTSRELLESFLSNLSSCLGHWSTDCVNELIVLEGSITISIK